MTQRGNLDVGRARMDTCKAILQLSQANPQAANNFGDGVQIGVGRVVSQFEIGLAKGCPFERRVLAQFNLNPSASRNPLPTFSSKRATAAALTSS